MADSGVRTAENFLSLAPPSTGCVPFLEPISTPTIFSTKYVAVLCGNSQTEINSRPIRLGVLSQYIICQQHTKYAHIAHRISQTVTTVSENTRHN